MTSIYGLFKKINFSFAKTSTVGFGSLAASQQQQSSVSVFGGSGFGALAQQPQKSSIFGGGLNSAVTNRFFICIAVVTFSVLFQIEG